jgi:hypothetical protein
LKGLWPTLIQGHAFFEPNEAGEIQREKFPPKEQLTPQLLSSLLAQLHKYASLITDLLDGKIVGWKLTPMWVLNKPTGKVQDVWKLDRRREDVLLLDLIDLIKHDPFPFRRCPVCQTTFVPIRKQKYCSPNCTYKGIETARKEERRVYMKEYQQRKRKEQQKQQQRGQTKLRRVREV